MNKGGSDNKVRVNLRVLEATQEQQVIDVLRNAGGYATLRRQTSRIR